MKVLVTGGSGFLGKRLQKHKPDWIYISSKNVDLTCPEDTKKFIKSINPDAVVHLAAKVGGIKDNAEHPADFFIKNTKINLNVVDACFALKVNRVLASLSTCAFPNEVGKYPFTEEDLLYGPPADTNLSYGYSKRLLWVHINALRKQYNVNYSCFSPSNIYGPEDNFDLNTSHFVPAAIKKIVNSSGEVTFWGTGESLRQQLYVDDLCKAIPLMLDKHNTNIPMIVAPDENLSIKTMVETICLATNKNLKVKFDGTLTGQHRKDGSNHKFKSLFPDFKFTSFYDGIKETIKWYEESINNRN